MKRSTMTLGGGVALFAAVATVFAAGNMKAVFQRQYDKACVAMRSGNWDKMEKSLMSMGTKNFKMVAADGKEMSGEDSMKMMKQQMAGIKKFNSCSYVVNKVSATSDTATTWTTYSMSMTTKPGPDHKSHKIKVSGKGQDSWVKVGKDWKMSVMKTVKETTTMDGKPLPPGSMGG